MYKIPVTVYTSSKNRYDTTLPACLLSIANQTFFPAEVILFDDSDIKQDLRNHPLIGNIFNIFEIKGIKWKVIYGAGKGQLLNHRNAIEIAENDLIMRIDDDCFMENNVLEQLFNTIKCIPNTGAVGCSIIEPKKAIEMPTIASNKIDDIYLGVNRQWFLPKTKEIEEVDHLYSSFLYDRTKAKKEFYEYNYSPLAHREETIFTYSIKLSGFKILFDPNVRLWHCHPLTGGGNENKLKNEYAINDTNIFHTFLQTNNIKLNEPIIIVLDNGIGDHFAFMHILEDLKKKNKKLIIACCYPAVFDDVLDDNIILISIAECVSLFGTGILEHRNIYRFMDLQQRQFNVKMNLVEAFRRMYL